MRTSIQSLILAFAFMPLMLGCASYLKLSSYRYEDNENQKIAEAVCDKPELGSKEIIAVPLDDSNGSIEIVSGSYSPAGLVGVLGIPFIPHLGNFIDDFGIGFLIRIKAEEKIISLDLSKILFQNQNQTRKIDSFYEVIEESTWKPKYQDLKTPLVTVPKTKIAVYYIEFEKVHNFSKGSLILPPMGEKNSALVVPLKKVERWQYKPFVLMGLGNKHNGTQCLN
ncbi:MAG: hypothetical protein CL674_15970 [Bdellovibrionaceae bacterium]|nr:hypothetical protein [Pseudobdellovibrionaceae bacterium]|tara:strand:- start:522 stop:1193 length:672 start_codon:yes stop_codon:yes gene_type:complete